MKKRLRQMFLVMAMLHAAAAHAEPTVKLSPATNDFVVGNTYRIQIMMQGFPVTEGGGVSLEFNPAMLQVANVQVDNATWGFVNRNGEIDNDSGKVSDIVFSDFSGVSGTAAIATVEVKPLKPGRSLLKLSPSMLNPFASGGEPIEVTLGSAQVMSKKR